MNTHKPSTSTDTCPIFIIGMRMSE
jgi:hypothetical protein